MNIENETRRAFRSWILEKIAGGSKGLNVPASHAYEPLGGTTKQVVVINNEYDGRDLVHNPFWLAIGRKNWKVTPAP